MKSAAILDLLFYRLTQCGAITGTGNGYSAIFYHSTRLCNRFMEAAILEQQEQQEKVDYKESFPTTVIAMGMNVAIFSIQWIALQYFRTQGRAFMNKRNSMGQVLSPGDP